MLRRTARLPPAGSPLGAPPPDTEAQLEERLAEPTPGVLEALRTQGGDIVILGAAGKMGPTLARMTRRAYDILGRHDRVIAVSRFSSGDAQQRLRAAHVETVTCDLADPRAVAALPDAANVVFMAGQKFGTASDPAATWMMNTVVPAYAATRYAGSRIVAFSTGNVYPLMPVESGGAPESEPPAPVGEYAASCLGRERVLEFITRRAGTPITIMRLNYAVELRYGVLVDIARAVLHNDPIDVSMGYLNAIWQGDACARALQCLTLAASPPTIVNVTGVETLSVRALAEHAASMLGSAARFVGEEASDALLSNAGRSVELFGPPTVSVGQMMAWITDWLRRGGRVLGAPTHFQERRGQF